MEVKLPVAGDTSDLEFNSIAFEKKLASLKDSQDSINSCCQWCLQNKQHHKKIVCCWLNVLKRVKIEHRLTLFYLANDVIQYSKRRNYDFVESWGTTLQKATTMVRDEKVKNKILRIFKIWEERSIYGEEFIADLCGLISASPSSRKGDEPHEFQSTYLIQKIRTCTKLESDTDAKLKQLKEHNPKIQIESESLILSLKDRAHVDDVEKEIDDYSKQMENYINALKCEIKARIHLISLLTQAETQLGNDKKDVKLVTNAYKTFAGRVKILKKKLDEKIPTLTSPVPSPDIDAPSPSPDSDIELPNNENTSASPSITSTPPRTQNLLNNSSTLFTNAGYYNPVPPPTPDSNSTNFNNNFTSFIGSNLPFNLQNFDATSLFGSNQNQNSTSNTTSQTQTTNSYSINNSISSLFPSMACPPPPPAPNIPETGPPTTDYQFNNSSHVPLLPPPMPPFNKSDDGFGGPPYGDTYNGSNNSNYGYESDTSYQPTPEPYQTTAPTYPSKPPYQPPAHNYQPPLQPPPTATFESFNSPYPPPPARPYRNPDPPAQNPLPNYPTGVPPPYARPEEYNPEEEPETWEPEPTWEQPPPVELDTPESPPLFEKEGYGDPIEYHDGSTFEGGEDVDHRVFPSIITDPVVAGKEPSHRMKDVDHRNLISLTGSPSESRPVWTSQGGDQDYRKTSLMKKNNLDQDYRAPFDIENLKLPPPPPPPNMLTNHGLDSNPFNPNIKTGIPLVPISPGNIENRNAGMHRFNQQKRPGLSPRKLQDNTESIDMDLSEDEENEQDIERETDEQDELNINSSQESLSACDSLLPPPFPDLLDDVDANNFLDNVTEDLDLEDFGAGDLECMDQSNNSPNIQSGPNLKPGLLGAAPLLPFPPNFSNPPNPNMFNKPPPVNMPPNVPSQELPPNWLDQRFNNEEFHNEEFNEHEGFHRQDFPFRGRGGNFRGNFNNNRGTRGNWVNRGNNEFRGRGRGGQPRGMRAGMPFRGNRGGNMPRGNWGGRGRGGNRGRGDFRGGRGDFRGNFRGGF